MSTTTKKPNYWQELRKQRKAEGNAAIEFYTTRINNLLDLKGLGKTSRDYEPQLVNVAAKAWMMLDRNKDVLKLTNNYHSRYFNPGDDPNEAPIDDSPYVKEVLRHRTILEGCLMAMGLPTRIAYEIKSLNK